MKRPTLDSLISSIAKTQESDLNMILMGTDFHGADQDSKQLLYDITVSSIDPAGGPQDSISNTKQSMRGELISIQKHLEEEGVPDSSLILPSMTSDLPTTS
jgi:hypothetical protein